MIGRLTGSVTQEDDGTMIVDVHGVGFEVIAPVGTIGRAKTDDHGRVTLFIHTHVREDTLSLFGFASDSDRLAFRTLIGISSVGPKTAIAILSALPAPELGQAITRNELGKLTSISGVGKKTAERLLLELKDKLPIRETAGPRAHAVLGAATATSHAEANASDLLARTLINMGFRQVEADRAIEQLGAKVEGHTLPDLLKEALAVLSK